MFVLYTLIFLDIPLLFRFLQLIVLPAAGNKRKAQENMFILYTTGAWLLQLSQM